MQFPLDRLFLDHSVQSREAMNTETVQDYADRMTAGDAFPPVVLFGSVDDNAWIGDGWHRIAAAKQLGWTHIEADLRPGKKIDALKYAVGANGDNGLPRTNADKRRAVSLALAAWPELSASQIAELCKVHESTVHRHPSYASSCNAGTHTGKDGKQYHPTKRQPRDPAPTPPEKPEAPEDDEPKYTRARDVIPCIGHVIAGQAIEKLDSIHKRDKRRADAIRMVREWLNCNEEETT